MGAAAAVGAAAGTAVETVRSRVTAAAGAGVAETVLVTSVIRRADSAGGRVVADEAAAVGNVVGADAGRAVEAGGGSVVDAGGAPVGAALAAEDSLLAEAISVPAPSPSSVVTTQTEAAATTATAASDAAAKAGAHLWPAGGKIRSRRVESHEGLDCSPKRASNRSHGSHVVGTFSASDAKYSRRRRSISWSGESLLAMAINLPVAEFFQLAPELPQRPV